MSIKNIILTFIATFLVLTGLSTFTIIPAGSRGVITQFGHVVPTVLDEGFHLVVPIRDNVHILSARYEKHQVDATASTKDLQELHSTFAVNYFLEPQQMPTTYQSVGDLDNILEKIIGPQVQEAFKTAASKFNAEESVVNRDQLKDLFDQNLVTRLDKYGIGVIDTAVVDIDFSPQFSQAVEEKQIAEQTAQKAVYVAQQAAQDAQAAINKAQGEAEAQGLLQKTLTPDVLRKLELDNQASAIAKWNGVLPQFTGNGATPLINFPS